MRKLVSVDANESRAERDRQRRWPVGVTTVTGVVGFFVFLGLAAAFLL